MTHPSSSSHSDLDPSGSRKRVSKFQALLAYLILMLTAASTLWTGQETVPVPNLVLGGSLLIAVVLIYRRSQLGRLLAFGALTVMFVWWVWVILTYSVPLLAGKSAAEVVVAFLPAVILWTLAVYALSVVHRMYRK